MSSATTQERLISETRQALADIDYQPQLIIENYAFGDERSLAADPRRIALAAFAQEPPSVRSATFGLAVVPNATPDAVNALRSLGAPHVFAFDPPTGVIHRFMVRAEKSPLKLDEFPAEHLQQKIRQHAGEWNPGAVLRAKTIGLAERHPQLSFVDIGLVPALEQEAHRHLDELLRNVTAATRDKYEELTGTSVPSKLLFRLIFRLLAAKLLADRQGGEWNEQDAERVIARIEKIYFQNGQTPEVLQHGPVRQFAWRKMREAFHLQNLSVEALAHVYETTMVDADVRRELGIHATPAGIAEYMVQHLPFEELPREGRRVFEPFCGHAPFLIAALGRLRALLPVDWDAATRHSYFVDRLLGLESDVFALEVARYSMILADYPNHNGWQLQEADAFQPEPLSSFVEQSDVVLCNPPFQAFDEVEKRQYRDTQTPEKEIEVLRRILVHPPKMLGFVLPKVFINGQSYREIHRQLARAYRKIDLVALPEGVFTYTNAETVLLLASRTPGGERRWTSAEVERKDLSRFLMTGSPTWQVKASEAVLQNTDEPRLWTTPLERVMEALARFPKLGTVADVHRGVEYNEWAKQRGLDQPSDVRRDGDVLGVHRARECLEPYRVKSTAYINTLPEGMLYEAYKLPWKLPKLLVGAARRIMDRWLIEAAIDTEGLVATQRFHGVWPKVPDWPIEVLAAILNGPVANAVASLRRTGRDVQVGSLRDIPIPDLSERAKETVTNLVREYVSLRAQLASSAGQEVALGTRFREIVWQIDVTILDGYDLSPDCRSVLLDYFDGYQRPGPVGFERFYPVERSGSGTERDLFHQEEYLIGARPRVMRGAEKKAWAIRSLFEEWKSQEKHPVPVEIEERSPVRMREPLDE